MPATEPAAGAAVGSTVGSAAADDAPPDLPPPLARALDLFAAPPSARPATAEWLVFLRALRPDLLRDWRLGEDFVFQDYLHQRAAYELRTAGEPGEALALLDAFRVAFPAWPVGADARRLEAEAALQLDDRARAAAAVEAGLAALGHAPDADPDDGDAFPAAATLDDAARATFVQLLCLRAQDQQTDRRLTAAAHTLRWACRIETRDPAARAQRLVCRIDQQMLRADFEFAHELVAELRALLAGRSAPEPYLELYLGLALSGSGQFDEAREPLRSARGAAGLPDDLRLLAAAQLVQGEVLGGEPAAAIASAIADAERVRTAAAGNARAAEPEAKLTAAVGEAWLRHGDAIGLHGPSVRARLQACFDGMLERWGRAPRRAGGLGLLFSDDRAWVLSCLLRLDAREGSMPAAAGGRSADAMSAESTAAATPPTPASSTPPPASRLSAPTRPTPTRPAPTLPTPTLPAPTSSTPAPSTAAAAPDGPLRCLATLLRVEACANVPGSPVLDPPAARSRLCRPGEGLVVIVPARAGSLLLLCDAQGGELVELSTSAAELRAASDACLAAARAAAIDDDAATAARACERARDLAALLVPAPLAAALQRRQRVRVSSLGLLAGLPFEILPSAAGSDAGGEAGPLLGERVAVAHVVSLAHDVASLPPHWRERALVMGTLQPAETIASRLGVARHAFDPALLAACAAPYGADTPVLADADVLPSRLLAPALARVGTLHLVAHGCRHHADGENVNALALAPEPRFPTGLLWGGSDQELACPPVVVLSACGHGDAARMRGNHPLAASLAGAYLRGGTRCVVTPLVPVPVGEHCVLMAAYHEAAAAGSPPDVAMQRARAARAAAGDPLCARLRHALVQVHGAGVE